MNIKNWTIVIAVASILIGSYRIISEKPIQRANLDSSDTIRIKENSIWQQYHSSEGNFTAFFPGDFQEMTQKVIMPGIGQLENQIILSGNGNANYGISVVDYPQEYTNRLKNIENGVERFLSKMVEQQTSDIGLIEKKSIEINNVPCQQFSLILTSESQSKFKKGMFCLKDNRLYTVQALIPRSQAENNSGNSADLFLDFFTIETNFDS